MSDQDTTGQSSGESGSSQTDQPQSSSQPNASQQSPSQQMRGEGRHGGRRRSGGSGFNQQHPAGEPRRNESRDEAGNVTSVNMTELRDLVELIATHGFTDFELEREGFRVRLRREQPTQIVHAQSSPQMYAPPPPVPPPAPVAPAPPVADVATTVAPAAENAETSDADLRTITSPIVGTFYRSPSPTADMFVKVGSTIEPNSVVCIVEAMKLMNEILAETSGTIEKIYVENAQPVEFGQPLFGVRK